MENLILRGVFEVTILAPTTLKGQLASILPKFGAKMPLLGHGEQLQKYNFFLVDFDVESDFKGGLWSNNFGSDDSKGPNSLIFIKIWSDQNLSKHSIWLTPDFDFAKVKLKNWSTPDFDFF